MNLFYEPYKKTPDEMISPGVLFNLLHNRKNPVLQPIVS
jgi:hypothetical protein